MRVRRIEQLVRLLHNCDAEPITGMPRTAGGTAVAALPFSLPNLLRLPGQPAAQWQVHIDRLTQARALAGCLEGDLNLARGSELKTIPSPALGAPTNHLR